MVKKCKTEVKHEPVDAFVDVEMQAPAIKQEPQEVPAEDTRAGEAVEAPSVDVLADVEMPASEIILEPQEILAEDGIAGDQFYMGWAGKNAQDYRRMCVDVNFTPNLIAEARMHCTWPFGKSLQDTQDVQRTAGEAQRAAGECKNVDPFHAQLFQDLRVLLDATNGAYPPPDLPAMSCKECGLRTPVNSPLPCLGHLWTFLPWCLDAPCDGLLWKCPEPQCYENDADGKLRLWYWRHAKPMCGLDARQHGPSLCLHGVPFIKWLLAPGLSDAESFNYANLMMGLAQLSWLISRLNTLRTSCKDGKLTNTTKQLFESLPNWTWDLHSRPQTRIVFDDPLYCDSFLYGRVADGMDRSGRTLLEMEWKSRQQEWFGEVLSEGWQIHLWWFMSKDEEDCVPSDAIWEWWHEAAERSGLPTGFLRKRIRVDWDELMNLCKWWTNTQADRLA